ncbi:MAG: hypothetical protein JW855_01695, partial [Gammaproteobacteria bacterium]|nr:hypothetical protein [Gammaproteobacteria bacterium]
QSSALAPEKLTALIQKMIEQGADLEAQTENGQTALHYLCHKHPEKLTSAIIALFQACLNVPNKEDDRTPLHFLCGSDQSSDLTPEKLTALIQKMIEQGAEPKAQDEDGRTALHILCNKHPEKLTPEIIALFQACLNVPNKHGVTPLHYLCFSDQFSDLTSETFTALVQKMVEQGADPKAQTEDGWTALHFLCRYHPEKLTPEIIESFQACLNVREKRDSTPLHPLCWSDQSSDLTSETFTALVQKMIEQGADLEAQTEDGWTALHILCRYHPEKLAPEIIVLFQACLNVPNKEGLTPLHLFCWHSLKLSIEEFKVLFNEMIKKGGNLQIESSDGVLPLDYLFVRKDVTDIEKFKVYIQLVKKYGGNINRKSEKGLTALHAFFEGPKTITPEHINILLHAGGDIHIKSRSGAPAWISYFLRRKNPDPNILKKFIELGVDMNQRFEGIYHQAVTWLHAYYEHADVTEAFFDFLTKSQNFKTPLDFHVTDTGGNNLLHRYCQYNSTIHPRVIQRLIRQGIDPTAKNNDGKTALDLLYMHNRKQYTPKIREALCDDRLDVSKKLYDGSLSDSTMSISPERPQTLFFNNTHSKIDSDTFDHNPCHRDAANGVAFKEPDNLDKLSQKNAFGHTPLNIALFYLNGSYIEAYKSYSKILQTISHAQDNSGYGLMHHLLFGAVLLQHPREEILKTINFFRAKYPHVFALTDDKGKTAYDYAKQYAFDPEITALLESSDSNQPYSIEKKPISDQASELYTKDVLRQILKAYYRNSISDSEVDFIVQIIIERIPILQSSKGFSYSFGYGGFAAWWLHNIRDTQGFFKLKAIKYFNSFKYGYGFDLNQLREILFLKLASLLGIAPKPKFCVSDQSSQKLKQLYLACPIIPITLKTLKNELGFIQHKLLAAYQLIRSVQTLLDHQIFHLDLKPANVLVKLYHQYPFCKISMTDFGLTKISVQDSAISGTETYFSPEKAARKFYDYGHDNEFSLFQIILGLLFRLNTGSEEIKPDERLRRMIKEALKEEHYQQETKPFPAVTSFLNTMDIETFIQDPVSRTQVIHNLLSCVQDDLLNTHRSSQKWIDAYENQLKQTQSEHQEDIEILKNVLQCLENKLLPQLPQHPKQSEKTRSDQKKRKPWNRRGTLFSSKQLPFITAKQSSPNLTGMSFHKQCK